MTEPRGAALRASRCSIEMCSRFQRTCTVVVHVWMGHGYKEPWIPILHVPPAGRSPETIKRAEHAHRAQLGEVGCRSSWSSRCGGHQLFDGPDIGARLDEVGGERVAEGVAGDLLGDREAAGDGRDRFWIALGCRWKWWTMPERGSTQSREAGNTHCHLQLGAARGSLRS